MTIVSVYTKAVAMFHQLFGFFSGIKISEINRAEGERQAAILASEAEREAQINRAMGEANAILAKAKARAESLEVLSQAIGKKVRTTHTSTLCNLPFEFFNDPPN